jgi:soluble lytic murein transglycosylase-like protein
MRHIVSIGVIALILLLSYGFVVAASGANQRAAGTRVIYVQSESETEKLHMEIERLRTISSIREVLEAYYPEASFEAKRELADVIFDSCRLYDLEVELVLAVIKTESAFRDSAVSNKGALGLMQVQPLTGMAMAEELDLQWRDKDSLLDSRTNIMLGCYYLKKLLDRYGRLDQALLAYNAGPTRIDELLAKQELIPGTYAKMVDRNMKLLTKEHFSYKQEDPQ